MPSSKARAAYDANSLVPAHVLLKTHVDCIVTHVEFSNENIFCEKKSKTRSHFFAETEPTRPMVHPHVNVMVA